MTEVKEAVLRVEWKDGTSSLYFGFNLTDDYVDYIPDSKQFIVGGKATIPAKNVRIVVLEPFLIEPEEDEKEDSREHFNHIHFAKSEPGAGELFHVKQAETNEKTATLEDVLGALERIADAVEKASNRNSYPIVPNTSPNRTWPSTQPWVTW